MKIICIHPGIDSVFAKILSILSNVFAEFLELQYKFLQFVFETFDNIYLFFTENIPR